MARMYPRELPRHVLENPKLSSEVRVYERMRDKLPGDYNCYYSRSWHEADRDGAEFDGEADFIVAHAEHGLLFLEVKGGRVSCREADGQWLSEDRDGFKFRIKNPLSQARSSKHHFLKRLNASRALSGRFVRARHGAILPGSARPRRALAPDAPLEIIAFGDDMETLDRWIVRRMTEGDDHRESALGLDGLRALEELLASHFELRAHIGISLADDARTIERLTAEQSWILDSLADNKEMAISGGAGSGKTVLAVEKATRSAADGRRTLLTCYNAPLAAHLRTICQGNEGLVVASFHALCRALAQKAGVELPSDGDQSVFDHLLPEALVDAVSNNPDLGFDTVIIDEGQDFRDSWLHALRLTINDPETGGFYVFYDDNQRLFSPEKGFIDALPASSIALTRNLRNTRRIHALMAKWYQGRRSIPAGPEGEPVGTMACRNGEMALARLNERISQMLNSGQVAPGQIAVLSGTGDALTALGERIAGKPTCRADDVRPDHIVLDTVRRFKGLSRPCIFLIGIEGLTDPELIYVATSRANVLLEIIGTAEDIARLKQEVAAAGP
ncbi:NERD domain-containing protein [Albidovulum sediminicola]|uniref:NERD domain-containing protein n=1 Tax=Albidovulum sediminicola TaxID=2984331 RepID=A0ABT2YZU5_9RHOB|nr:NERD domain-containing protein [Defluviimonas sp. WL0075]MCV2864401.1 NERD domain-containing protein [Defluviimonas sp. WL0075]